MPVKSKKKKKKFGHKLPKIKLPKFRVGFMGAGLLSSGAALINLVPAKWGWWTGILFLVSGPFVMGFKSPEDK